MHTVADVVGDVISLVSNMKTKELTDAVRAVEISCHKLRDVDSVVPYHLSPEASRIFDMLAASIKLPSWVHGTSLPAPIGSFRQVTSHIAQLIGSDVFAYCVSAYDSGLSYDVRNVIVELFRWLQLSCACAHTERGLQYLADSIAVILSTAELLLPFNMQSYVMHTLHHFVRSLRDAGPAFCHWLYYAERRAAAIVERLHSFKGAPLGLLRAWFGYVIAGEMSLFFHSALGSPSEAEHTKAAASMHHGKFPVSAGFSVWPRRSQSRHRRKTRRSKRRPSTASPSSSRTATSSASSRKAKSRTTAN
jgi:hypothetical protein